MRWFWRVAIYSFFAVLVAYLADTAVWAARGQLIGQVQIREVTAASQKGGKEEYFLDQTTTAPCGQRWFPMPTTAGMVAPCWWLLGHQEHLQRL